MTTPPNPIERLLNPSPAPPNTRPPMLPKPPPAPAPAPSAAGQMEGNRALMRKAGQEAPALESQARTAAKTFGPDSDRAASALGEWATGKALEQTVTQWSRALFRLADEIDFLGGAVVRCADTQQWADEETRAAVTRIRAGGG